MVDDASTDDSLSVANSLAEKYPAVSVIAHPVNRGIVDAFNSGASAATGEFVVRLDADDLLTPGSLQRATALAAAHPSVGLVYGHPLHFSGSLPPARTNVTKWTVWPGRDWLAGRCQSGKNVITSPEVLMRRSILEIAGPMAQLAHSHDMELWLRLAAYGDVGYVHGADQAWHREHNASVSATSVTGLVDLHERRAAFSTLFEGLAARRGTPDRLAATSRQTLVAEVLFTAQLELDRGLHDRILFQAYLDFAAETDPHVVTSQVWKGLQRKAATKAGLHHAPFRLARRVQNRFRNELSLRRWKREGVF